MILELDKPQGITTAEVRKYIASRQEAEASNAEINLELSALKRGFNLVAQAGKIYTEPYIPMLQENNVRKGFFEREQFEAVRKHLPDDLRPMITFAFITGWRIPSEVLKLQWRQVDFQAGTVWHDQERRRPAVSLHSRAPRGTGRSEGKNGFTPQERCDLSLGFHRRGRPIKKFRRSWALACATAALPGRIPHDFRRTAVRNLFRAGIPERVAMQMIVHKTRSVFERYIIISESDLREAAASLDRVADTISDTIRPSANSVQMQPAYR
jgi:integrase